MRSLPQQGSLLCSASGTAAFFASSTHLKSCLFLRFPGLTIFELQAACDCHHVSTTARLSVASVLRSMESPANPGEGLLFLGSLFGNTQLLSWKRSHKVGGQKAQSEVHWPMVDATFIDSAAPIHDAVLIKNEKGWVALRALMISFVIVGLRVPWNIQLFGAGLVSLPWLGICCTWDSTSHRY